MQLNFQTKVLLPVITLLALLIIVPMWIVSHRMSLQLETSAADGLRTAEAVFNNLQSLHGKTLLERYRSVVNEPRVKAVLQQSDQKTVAVLLKDLLEEMGGDVVMFADQRAQPVAQTTGRPDFHLDEFAARSVDIIRQALASPDQPARTTISAGGHLYDALSIPVSVREDVVAGVLTFGIDDAVVRQFKEITRSEILLLANDRVAAATLRASELSNEFTNVLHGSARGQSGAKSREQRPDTIRINGEHFMFVGRPLGYPQADPSLRYVLLSSYEKPLRTWQSMQQNFLWIQFIGILGGAVLVWLLVRRLTSPLRELRDNAEAVGHGDFSRRAEIRSSDECGKLAAVFNRMTENLQASREELEKTVDTLKTTQAQLIQSEKLRAVGTLAGGIAHDFNNILAAILGFGELALEDVPPASRTARNLRQVIKGGERAKDLVRQILAFSRQNEPKRVTMRLSGLVDETLTLLRATIPTTVEIRNQVRTQLDTVIGDPTQLHQVLMNLGTNASHAMREHGGLLSMTLDGVDLPQEQNAEAPSLPRGSYLRLSVQDSGHGMTQEVMERIFEPFYTTKPIGEGTGLGLSVVHGIVKNHGGEITVRSEPGVGTTFSIYLPRSEGHEAQQGPADETLPGHGERILVVDDEEALANLMQQRLTRLGYEVVAHCDSLAAFRAFQSAPCRFDVVITDQTMPRLTGDDLARKIVSLRPDTPVILCSGSGHTFLEAAGQCEAVRYFVAKPINLTELSRRIRDVLKPKPKAPRA